MKDNSTVDRFGLGLVSRLSGLSRSTLHYWDTIGVLRPSIQTARGPGSRKVYSFTDVAAARTAKQLRRQGVSLADLRRIVRELRNHDLFHLAEARLILSGKEVYIKTASEVSAMLQRPGQLHLPFFSVFDLEATVKAIDRAAPKKLPSKEAATATAKKKRFTA